MSPMHVCPACEGDNPKCVTTCGGMPMTEVREWAIQDEATGEWWASPCVWSRDCEFRMATYAQAAARFVNNCGDRKVTARIVPAPPREMTDAECVTWLESVTRILDTDGGSGINGIRFNPGYDAFGRRCERGSWHVKHQDGSSAGCAEGFFDAIRAAAKKVGA